MAMNRINIGIFGRINAGKSTLMNLLSQQELSIVDSKPGTTADVKVTVMEIHGYSPVKIFDTAGIDESGELGDKKRNKSFGALKRSDMVLLVINAGNRPYIDDDFYAEDRIIEAANQRNKEIFIIFNIFCSAEGVSPYSDRAGITVDRIRERYEHIQTIAMDLSETENYNALVEFIKSHSRLKTRKTPLLPALSRDRVVFLNIPIDEESPEGRFLRPQMMIEEYLVRRFIPTFAYRMDLKKARSVNTEVSLSERSRFHDFINYLNQAGRLQLLITDSQAMDIVPEWCQNIDIDFTTFSIVMINYLSGGRLELFVEGLRTFDNLQSGDRIMIAEGCNHDRKAEDIGTVQIPALIEKRFGKRSIGIDHYFGRVFADYEKLSQYKLIIHCGGCMLDEQNMRARIDDLMESGISFTNYGLLLSYFRGKESLNRAIRIFGLSLS